MPDGCRNPEKERQRVLNVISLEFSASPLKPLVTAPAAARELDCLSHCWIDDPSGAVQKPQVCTRVNCCLLALFFCFYCCLFVWGNCQPLTHSHTLTHTLTHSHTHNVCVSLCCIRSSTTASWVQRILTQTFTLTLAGLQFGTTYFRFVAALLWLLRLLLYVALCGMNHCLPARVLCPHSL